MRSGGWELEEGQVSIKTNNNGTEKSKVDLQQGSRGTATTGSERSTRTTTTATATATATGKSKQHG
jgi:hypothetical protein